MTHIIIDKEESKIVEEWDEIAAVREFQISSGIDHSAIKVLSPAILREITTGSSLIDIGCGTGWLTAQASTMCSTCLGIDPSEKSIEIANAKYGNKDLSFIKSSVENFSSNGEVFETAILNMVASNVLNLDSFIAAVKKVLKLNGVMIMTIPHPCFWPQYWGYADDDDFAYSETCMVEGHFKIQNDTTGHTTTHFHHPLEKYFSTLFLEGFSVEKLIELRGKGFNFPRFLLIKAKVI